MTTISKRVLAIALTGALLVPAMTTAEAGPRGGWDNHRGGWNHHEPRRHHDGRRKKNNDVGAAVAAGIIGLAAGAILLGATSQPRYAEPAPNYYPPAPYPGRVSGYGYQPWSPAWYDYCSSKYRTFNPSTGTYTTYRGEQKFCQ
ncbi:BA14K family protein [Roseibium aggregatum]|uniref:Lectin-like protein BA14k n=1 Tax=Roseibium aggregatum TaxID=187304 RepID=A0A926NU86_9HYPH|nr:BA14K family protein [Roseibium aggregatum]MBD1547482.1 BA14K family protein [Roseibium aggregatum]